MAIEDLERILGAPQMPLQPYPAKVITLANGKEMVVREAKKEEVGVLLGTVYPLVGVAKDFYDVVAARMYEELLAWYRNRIANMFAIVGVIDGTIAGIVTSRQVHEKLGMSLHTLAIDRGLRVGAHLFAAKMENHIDVLGAGEVWIVAESPIGYKRWMLEYELEDRSSLYPEVRHELSGVPTHSLTRALWEKHRANKCTGLRPAPAHLLATAAKLKMPNRYPQIPGFKREQWQRASA
ncbi:MAG TPA: hypothetical protein VKV05_05855 [Terriglobales bacterium]|nr:hypothetical protein [Terriglobales bacterium]